MKNDYQYEVQEVTISASQGFTVAEDKEGYSLDKSSANTANAANTFMGNGNLAKFLGGSDYAIIINKLQLLTKSLTGCFIDGQKWLRIGLFAGEEEITWAAMIEWLSPVTIKKYLTQLKGDGLIEFKQIKGKGRSLYYWLNTQAVAALNQPVARVAKNQAVKVTNLGKSSNIVKSDLSNREVTYVKSDLSNSAITPTYSINQVSLVDELSLSNRDTSKNHENTENNQESHTACEIFSPLAIVMAKALGLDLSIKKNLNCVNLALDKLNGLYKDDVTETNIIKVASAVLEKHGASPAKVFSHWSKLLAEPITTEVELKAKELQEKIEAVANGIKGICKPPSTLGWEDKSVKAKKQLLMNLAANIVANNQESKLETFTWYGGNEQPSIHQFNGAWVDHVTGKKSTNHKGELNHASNQPNIDPYAVPAGGKLARVTFM